MLASCASHKDGCCWCDSPTKSVFHELQGQYGEKRKINEFQYNFKSATLTIRETVLVEDSEGGDDRANVRQDIIDPNQTNLLEAIDLSKVKVKQTWSGYTYMTEKEKRDREVKYRKKLKVSLLQREQYDMIQGFREAQIMAQRSSDVGPEWFQDLSNKQMTIVDTLVGFMKADREEGIIARTQKFLSDLGVIPPLENRDVYKCLKESQLNPVRFLFLIHEQVVIMEEGEYEKRFMDCKKKGTYISPFSLNERLLLSAVFHSHFPQFLAKLDKLLPPPWKPALLKIARKPPKVKETYESPYLEPQPINEMCWYERRAEEELEAAVKRQNERLKRHALAEKLVREELEAQALKKKRMQESATVAEGESEMASKRSFSNKYHEPSVIFLERMGKSEYFSEMKFAKPQEKIYLEEETEESGEISQALSYKKENLHTKVEVIHATVQTKCGIGGFFMSDLTPIKNTEESSYLIKRVPDTTKNLHNGEEEDKQENIPFTMHLELGEIEVRSIGTDTEPIREFEPLASLLAPSTDGSSSSSISSDSVPDGGWNAKKSSQVSPFELPRKEHKPTNAPQTKKGRKEKKKGPKIEKPASLEICPFDSKPTNVECIDEECGLYEGEIPVDELSLKAKQIAILPPEKQLSAAVQYLCDKGDALAILPNIESVPWLTRWFEIRRGIKLTLTKAEKDDLLGRSRAAWGHGFKRPSSISPPFLPLSQDKQGRMTWDSKNFIMKMVRTEINKYSRAVKQLMVDNSRDLFPSMFCEYHRTPLNKGFRKTFFTYMPSREADSYIINPWNPATPKANKGDE